MHTMHEGVWKDAESYASPCDGWKVADVITHMISGGTSYAMSIARATQGLSTPPMGYQKKDADEALLSLVSLRVAFHEDLFPEFNASCKRLNTLLVEMEQEEYEKPVWHPHAIMPISRLIDYRALELAVHGWDVHYPFDRDAKLNEAAVPFLKSWMWRWFRGGFQKSAPLENPIRYRFELDDAIDESIDVIVTGDDFRLIPSEEKEATVTFHCDTNTYLLFGLGRLPFARSVRRGRLSFEGDEQTASQFTQWFKPI